MSLKSLSQKPASDYFIISSEALIKKISKEIKSEKPLQREYYIEIPENKAVVLSCGGALVLISKNRFSRKYFEIDFQVGLELISVDDQEYDITKQEVGLCGGNINVMRKGFIKHNNGNLIFTVPEEWC